MGVKVAHYNVEVLADIIQLLLQVLETEKISVDMSTIDFPKQILGDSFFVFFIQFLYLTNNKRLHLKLNFFLSFFLFLFFFIFALAVIILNFIHFSELLVARLTKPLLLAGYCRFSSAIDFCCCCCCCCRCCFCCCR